MKKFALILVLLGSFSAVFGQQWIDQSYEFDTIRDLTYGSALDFNNQPVDLQLDLFLPKCNDTNTTHPLMIVVHGGGFVAGSKDDYSVQAMCEQFAARGYATASIGYRLGYISDSVAHSCNLAGYQCLFAADSSEWYRSYFRGIQDAKGALRYLVNRKDLYHLDVDNIFLAGESAGAFVVLGAAFMDDNSERPVQANALPGLGVPNANTQTCDHNAGQTFSAPIARPDLGTIEGAIEPTSTPYTIRAVGNMFGGMFSDLLSVSATQPKPAIYSFHQACDLIVPWQSNKVYYGLSWCLSNGYGCFGISKTPIVHGSKTIENWNTNMGLGYDIQSDYVSTPFPYEYIGFQPKNCYDQVVNGNGCHEYANMNQQWLDMASFFANKISNPETCVPYNGILEIDGSSLSVYPNPTSSELHLKSYIHSLQKIEVLTIDGQLVYEESIQGNEYVHDFSDLPSGFYMLRIKADDRLISKAFVKGN